MRFVNTPWRFLATSRMPMATRAGGARRICIFPCVRESYVFVASASGTGNATGHRRSALRRAPLEKHRTCQSGSALC